MEYIVYFLISKKNGKRYVGYTRKSAEKRLEEHNWESNKWTRENGPFVLVYYEEYECERDARKRERFYKSGIGRKMRDAIIEVMQKSSDSAKGGPASGGG